MAETKLIRDAPVEVWYTGDWPKSANGDMISLHSVRVRNGAPVAVRINITIGRGANTQYYPFIVESGNDETHPEIPGTPPFPITVAGSDLGIVIEQV